MLKELAIKNIIQSKNIYAYKITLLLFITFLINNVYLFLFIFVFLLLTNYKEAFIYFILSLIIYYINEYRFDVNIIGIVESKNNNYYVLNKLFYKTKLYTDNSLEIGDIVRTLDYKLNLNKTDLKNNILFINDDYTYLYNLKFNNLIHNHINDYSEQIKPFIEKYIFNINNYDNDLNLLSGFTLYLILNNLSKSKPLTTIVIIVLYTILFSYQIKLIYLFIKIIINNTNIKKDFKYSITILIILIFNYELLKNKALLLPILFNLYNSIYLNIDFKEYLFIIETYMFSHTGLLHIFFYKFYLIINIFMFFITLLLFLFPSLSNIYLSIITILNSINNIEIYLNGRLTIIGLIFYYLIKKLIINNYILNIIVISLIILSPINYAFMSISFIDVGQGDAILIKYPLNSKNILIDTSSKYNYYKLKKYLYAKGIYNIDYLIITHNDSDHNGNIENLIKDFNIKNTILDGQDIKNNRIILNYLFIDNFDNDNDNSLVYLLDINNYRFLFTGDISSNAEKLFINKYSPIDIDVLKVSHHGSYTASSDYFISNILPKYAIISTSGQYNHPSKNTIDTLNKYDVNILSTRENGNITFYITRFFKIINYDTFRFVIIINDDIHYSR